MSGSVGAKMLTRPATLLAAWLASLGGIELVSAASPRDALDALVAAYPALLKSHDDTQLFWADGTVTPVGNQEQDKPFDQLLRNATILDQFRMPYPKGHLSKAPEVNVDPGRFRNQDFFRKMYGDCRKGEVQRHLVTVTWLPKTSGRKIRVTSVNGIASRLAAISAEIDELPAAIKEAAYPIAGVSSCRPVADTGQMSMHAYAAAIDLNLKFSDYWLWQRKSEPIPYRNRMPAEIVDIFERYGFIWGGKWYHYDTMHFEYRPELLGLSGR